MLALAAVSLPLAAAARQLTAIDVLNDVMLSLLTAVLVGVAALAALPVSMGVAILRFRLYEIDWTISRTLSYAIVTGLLIGVNVGLVLLATQVLTIKSPVAVAASTLAAAALFSPVGRRVQRVVDRRFDRAATTRTGPWRRSRPG